MVKRSRAEIGAPDEDATPRKTRRSARTKAAEAASPSAEQAETPSGRKSSLRGTPSKLNGISHVGATPKSLRKVLFSTPAKQDEEQSPSNGTPTAVRNDRSARRKSQRTLHQQVAVDEDSEDGDLAQDEAIAARILDEDESEEDEIDAGQSSAPDTPSKTGKPRGRPKGRRRERTPSPPPDLPPHELYFFQNRAGGNKTSTNTLPSHLLLNHEDYFAQIKAYQDPHKKDMERLKQLHKRAFDQWVFELEEGFNICLYGYGSKRQLAMDYAEHMYHQLDGKAKIVVVNGYTPGLTLKDILTTMANVVLPKSAKLPAQPGALLDTLLASLAESPPTTAILLIIHSLDHLNLRKAAIQTMLARLAAHPSVSLLATCDTLNFGLLWDINLSRQFRFLFHDATTYEPFRVEIDVVEEVSALLGRSRRRLGGKDGVGYVLRSLPENARALFRILVAEQLALADSDPGLGASNGDDIGTDQEDILGAEDEDEAAAQQNTPSRRGRKKKQKETPQRPPPKPVMVSVPEGVEYRTLYHKAVEEFVCSSELNFRTLLKEFHDHQVIESKKDAAGTERLVVPFRREELEAILEELV
ncbi:Origin recognition complex subunit 2 (ORC2) [Teratosphaeria destructans]|uniref:Origin recognition complex subunit 2 n=1 Tax=Teratosphaeria destructans TaxID=418781 RepID=A0A9W7VZZ4_9PEZI|nr:Origin recognition complex subunit 2 (ORC2) [Teratosphaeria destructans]